MRIAIVALIFLAGCAKAPAHRQYITPQHTVIRLKQRCPLANDGRPDKSCVFVVRIDATEVGE